MIFLFGCPVAGQANRKTCPVSGQANCIFDIHMSCSRTTVSQTKVFHLSCSRTHILYIAIYPGIKADMYKRVSVHWIPLPQGALKGVVITDTLTDGDMQERRLSASRIFGALSLMAF